MAIRTDRTVQLALATNDVVHHDFHREPRSVVVVAPSTEQPMFLPLGPL